MPRLFSFIETDVFRKQLDRLTTLDTLFVIQRDLLENPKRGDVIAGTKRVRKSRAADSRTKRGKSGGFRYLYLLVDHVGIIYLIYIFPKSEKVNISNEDKVEIAELVQYLKELYKE